MLSHCPSTSRAYGVVMEEMEEEDEKEGQWEVLGRGEAQLPKHLGSSEVRDENAMLFIANFVVDASCCSNLWWNLVREAHDFAVTCTSRLASRPGSSPWR